MTVAVGYSGEVCLKFGFEERSVSNALRRDIAQ